jgi:hypothetical protein
MFKRSFNKKFFFVLVILCSTFLTFGQEILALFADIQLERLSKKYLDVTLKYEELELTKQGFILKGIKNQEIEGSPLAFQGELEVNYQLEWANRRFLVDFVLKNAHLKTDDFKRLMEGVTSSPSQLASLFHIYPKLSVQDAKCSLKSRDHSIIDFSIDLDQKVRDSNDYYMKIGFNKGIEPEEYLECNIADRHQYLAFDLNFSQVSLKTFAQSLDSAYPHHLFKGVKEGILSGTSVFNWFSSSKVRLGKGNLDIEGFYFENPDLSFYLSKVDSDFIPSFQTSWEEVNKGNTEDLLQQFVSSLRRFDFLDNQSYLKLATTGDTVMDFSSITGRAEKNKNGDLHFNFVGNVFNEQERMNFSLLGRSFLSHQFFRNVQGNFSLEDQNQKKATLSYSIKEVDERKKTIDFHFNNLSSDFLSFSFPYSFNRLDTWDLSKGVFSGDCVLLLEDGGLSKVLSNSFSAQELSLQSKALSLDIGEMSGELNWDLLKEDGKQLSLNMEVENASFSALSFDAGYFQSKNTSGKFVLDDGVLNKASLDFQLDNIESHILWDQSLQSNPLSFSFKGKTKEVVKRINPDKYLQGVFSNEYLESTLDLSGEGFFEEDVFLLKGELGLDQKSFLEGLVNFDASFIKKDKVEKGKETSAYLIKTPGGVGSFFKDFLSSKTSISGHFLEEFRFLGKGLDLEQFLTPYLLDKEDEMLIKGQGDVKGKFKDEGLLLEYEARNVLVESRIFAIQCSELAGGIKPQMGFRARHYFDFKKRNHHGFIPIEDAFYQDKHFGMLFEKVSTSMFLFEKKMFFEEMKTEFDEMTFFGKLDLDLTPEKTVILKVKPERLEGDLSRAQTFLGKIIDAKKEELGFFGNFSLLPSSYLDITFTPEKDDIDLLLKGNINSSTFDIKGKDVVLSQAKGNFRFDLRSKNLDLHLDESLFSARRKNDDESSFLLSNSHFNFSNLPYWRCEFDVKLDKGTQSSIHFSGETFPTANEDGTVYHFNFDNQKTHIGEIFPHIKELTLRDWSELITFNSSPQLSFQTLVRDVSILSELNFIPMAEDLPKALTDYSFSGLARGELSFDKVSNLFHYNFSAKNVRAGPFSFNTFLILGKGKKDRLHIDELYSDDLFLTADFEKVGSFTRLNYLKAYFDKSISLHVREAFQNSSLGFEAKVSFLDIDFDYLKKRENLLSDALKLYLPDGQAKLQGIFNLDFEEGEDWKLSSRWDVLDHKLSFLKEPIEEISTFNLETFNNGDFHVSNANLTFQKENSETPSLELNLGQLELLASPAKIKLENSTLKVGRSNLDFLLGMLNLLQDEHNFLDYKLWFERFTESNKDQFSCNFEGEFTHKDFDFKLDFQDGRYALLPYSLDLEALTLKKDKDHWSLDFLSQIAKKKIKFSGQNHQGLLTKGSMLFEVDEESSESAILLEWNKQGESLDIESISGSLPGLELSMLKDITLTDTSDLVLQGKAKLDFSLLKHYFPAIVEEGIEKVGLGEGYTLEGELFLTRDFEELPVFKGTLKGKDFEVLDSKLDKLFSKIEIRPDRLQIFETFAKDKLGDFYIDTITLAERKDSRWELSVPLVRVENFYPKLFEPEKKGRKNKSMMVDLGELRGFKGIIGDDKSFIGNGVLEFKNVSKAFFFTPLLLIPGEIIARIGLDPNVISPHMGTILFEFGDGVIYVKEFRDVFSKGRRSRFYLASDQPSYINFDGGLNLRVKIEHYSLLLKPLDLTTITMKGKLSKPIYTIQKQQYQEIVKVGQGD